MRLEQVERQGSKVFRNECVIVLSLVAGLGGKNKLKIFYKRLVYIVYIIYLYLTIKRNSYEHNNI